MDEQRTSSRWQLWIGVTALMVPAYVLSVGPAHWLDSTIEIHPWIRDLLIGFYAPVAYLAQSGPPLVRDGLDWYVKYWTP